MNDFEHEVLRCGEYLIDDDLETASDTEHWIRIRVIYYLGNTYYHKMVNGNVVEFKKLEWLNDT